jgi:uncharacterized protein
MRKAFSRFLFPLFLFLAFAINSAQAAKEILYLEIGTETLTLEVSRSAEEHERGLMGRTVLKENEGMIFFFDPPQSVSFWMKNTPIDLDIAFIDAKGVVFHTDSMKAQTLNTHASFGFAAAAIELPCGALKRFGIGIGTEFVQLFRK